MENIILSSISGNTPPFQIYICDYLGNNCQFVKTLFNNVPPIDVIPIPDFFSGAPALNVKIIGVNSGCEKEENVVCSYFGNVLHTFCNCNDLNDCIYTENEINLSVGNVVSILEHDQCWVYSGYQFTNEMSQNFTIFKTYRNCQTCFNDIAPTYFSACCSDYTFTFDNDFQSGFTPDISWYVNIPASISGTGTGYTGCTVVISNYQTPNQTYVEADWNPLTNTEISTIFPFPTFRKCSDCTEVNPC
jgi:hypothetical protein